MSVTSEKEEVLIGPELQARGATGSDPEEQEGVHAAHKPGVRIYLPLSCYLYNVVQYCCSIQISVD